MVEKFSRVLLASSCVYSAASHEECYNLIVSSGLELNILVLYCNILHAFDVNSDE